MYVPSGSSFSLLVIYLCSLISVIEVRVAKPVAYEFGDRIPKTGDLDGSSSVERKATVVKRQPQTAYKPANVAVTAPPQILPKKAIVQRTRSAKKATIPIKKQQQLVTPNIVYNIAPAKQERITNTPVIKQQVTSPVVAHTTEPIKAITRKPEIVKREKTLQTPLTFSYNNDLKTSASHGGDYVVAESEGSHHGGGDVQGGGGGDGGNHHREPHDWSYEKGGGNKHNSGHHSAAGDKGIQEYDGDHEYEKAEKGYHDKEGHQGKYKDEVGNKKSHNYDDGIYGEYHKGEKGERGSKYDEEGEHSKGHNTKGEHNVHKKEEYEKKHEFYDEFHEGGDDEKHGEFHFEDGFNKGGSSKGAHHKSDNYEDHYGKKGHHLKEDHYDDSVGHNVADGHDKHYKHKAKHGKKGGYKDSKKWGHESGGGSGSRGKRGSGHPHHSPVYQVVENYDGYYDSDPVDGHKYYIVTHY